MTLVFDTTAFSGILDGDSRLIEAASSKEFDEYVLPLAADAELRYGFKNGNREALNLHAYVGIKKVYNVRVVAPDQDTSLTYAELAAWGRRHGISISNNDLWIAATCVQAGAQLLALDKDYTRLPQVSLVELGDCA